MLKTWLASITALLLYFVLTVSGCTKEEILPPSTPADPSPQAMGFPTNYFCCHVFGESRIMCEWAAQVERVLNCCYAEAPMQFCTWDSTAPIITDYHEFLGRSNNLLTPADIKWYLDSYTAFKSGERPGEGYLFERWEIENLGYSEPVNGTIFCNLGVTLYFRKVYCYLP